MNNKCCPEYDKSNEECINCKNEDRNRKLAAKLIILECKSFYATFKLIEPYIIKVQKNMTNLVYDEEDCENEIMYHFSYVVNGAFAVELAIKYLLTLANIDYCTGEKGHNLLDLYKKLSLNKKSIIPDKKVIFERLCELGHQNEETILLNLTSLQDCYNRYRYSFSYSSVGHSGFFGVLVNVICSYAIDKSNTLAEECEDGENEI